jgi:hypothetical protein
MLSRLSVSVSKAKTGAFLETIVVDAEDQAEEEAAALSFDNYETILEESQLIPGSVAKDNPTILAEMLSRLSVSVSKAKTGAFFRDQAEEEAAALSFDNYETILEESQLIAWIEKLKKALRLLLPPDLRHQRQSSLSA